MIFTEEQKCKLRLRILVKGERVASIAKEFGMSTNAFQRALYCDKTTVETKKTYHPRTICMLREAEEGASVRSLARKYGVSEQTIINHIKRS